MLAVECALSVRPDQRNNTLAHEYLDEPDVLDAKVDLLIDLLRRAKGKSVVYSGAGISKSSGIPDYASKASNSLVAAPKVASPILALPTLAHRVLTALHRREGWIGQWINQNHDGLAQKAGFPEKLCNSIHGDWFDPSNPVVQFSGSLRSDLFERLLQWEKRTTLCICLGTSLSGMNADRMAETPTEKCDLPRKMHKSRRVSADEIAAAANLGTVIVNLQSTRLDDVCTLRIWAKIDDVWALVAKKLSLAADEFAMPPRPFPALPDGTVYALPRYDANGRRLAADEPDSDTALDLAVGACIRIAHPDASNANAIGEIADPDEAENFVCVFRKKGKLQRVYTLGRWFIKAALDGDLEQLPIVNAVPTQEDSESK
jgi:NAD-dependent SIR2 family protein deacetylase